MAFSLYCKCWRFDFKKKSLAKVRNAFWETGQKKLLQDYCWKLKQISSDRMDQWGSVLDVQHVCFEASLCYAMEYDERMNACDHHFKWLYFHQFVVFLSRKIIVGVFDIKRKLNFLSIFCSHKATLNYCVRYTCDIESSVLKSSGSIFCFVLCCFFFTGFVDALRCLQWALWLACPSVLDTNA